MVQQTSVDEVLRREDSVKDEARGMLITVHNEGSKRTPVLEENYISVQSKAESEQNRMKQAMFEQKVSAESMRTNQDMELKYVQGMAITAPEEPQHPRGSIANHEAAYSSVCETLIAERKIPASTSASASSIGAILGKVERWRVELYEARADNERLIHNLFHTVSDLQVLQGRGKRTRGAHTTRGAHEGVLAPRKTSGAPFPPPPPTHRGV